MSSSQRVFFSVKTMQRDKKTTKTGSTPKHKKGLHYSNKKYTFIYFIYWI